MNNEKISGWVSCREMLPDQCKRYGVRNWGRHYSTSVRTPSPDEDVKPENIWLTAYGVTHWCELPDPYYEYSGHDDGWKKYLRPGTVVMFSEHEKPETEHTSEYFFVTKSTGNVDICLYNRFSQSFVRDEDMNDYIVAFKKMPFAVQDDETVEPEKFPTTEEMEAYIAELNKNKKSD